MMDLYTKRQKQVVIIWHVSGSMQEWFQRAVDLRVDKDLPLLAPACRLQIEVVPRSASYRIWILDMSSVQSHRRWEKLISREVGSTAVFRLRVTLTVTVTITKEVCSSCK